MLQITAATAAVSAFAPRISAKRKTASENSFGAVASDPPVVEIGEQILATGGNAIDAAVAAAFAAGVIIPSKTGIGGYGGAMTVALANGKRTCIDFNVMAPSAATPDMYALDAKGNVVGRKNFHGWLAAGVPGTCAGLQLALDRYGTKSLRELLQPAINLAKNNTKKDRYVDFTAYANTLGIFANRNSVESLYKGDIAEEIAATFQKNGGLVTKQDLAAYAAKEMEPYRLHWGEFEILTAPLGSVGLLPLQALAVLKALKWPAKLSANQATHARLEALRLAWKDRAEYYGDPAFVDVPVQRLLSEQYAEEQAAMVKGAVKAQKALQLKLERIEAIGTLHISTVDTHGNYVSVTLTQGSSYGAQVVVDSLGMVLGQGMARFDPRPGHPNSVAPHKRPVHNMAPSMLLKNGKPVVAMGAAGGTKIPNSVYDFFVHYIANHKSMEEALEQPRLNCIGAPMVQLEKSWPKAEADYLRKIGFDVKEGLGAMASAVTYDSHSKTGHGRTRVGNPFQESENVQ